MAENESAETAEVEETEGDEFDKDRALKTIRAQREKEKAQAAEIKRLKAIEAEVEEAKAKEAEASKGLETKLAEAEAANVELKSQLAKNEVKADFLAKAGARGYEDASLAYLAATDAGVLGELDPATGKVGVHDFDTLEEQYPALAGEAQEQRGFESGDAGVRGQRGKASVASQFNKTVRASL